MNAGANVAAVLFLLWPLNRSFNQDYFDCNFERLTQAVV